MRHASRTILLIALLFASSTAFAATGYTLIAWNDLGMHCVDGTDYSIFAVLPPYNTVNAQLIAADGTLVRNPSGITVTYEAVADTNGSINTTSIGKSNFWTYVKTIFGASIPPDAGLAGSHMPGSSNTPQPMVFDTNRGWFTAVGVPIFPIDDRGTKNYYPMMRVVARDAGGNVLASTNVVLPVSDEMDCRSCHASGAAPAARPAIGWAYDNDPARDVKLNVLAIHDQHQTANANYASALATRGYSASGLRATALSGTPILCASCHASNALGAAGLPPIQALTAAVHTRHDDAVDPTTGLSLGAMTTREACYRCHPGAQTRCLRGVMGSATAANGSYAIECQGCHGSMLAVGDASRRGWLDEPRCQSCHTGTATSNSGQIRYLNAFSSPGVARVPADPTFATSPDQPSAGLSLYRFSTGHGGLQCEACHGSTHAESPTPRPNDGVQNIAIQGHVGALAECEACHGSAPQTVNGGPHGLHPLGATWVSRHGDIADEGNTGACQACHGTDYRGTVLSRARGDRQLSTPFGAKTFWRGFQVSCYACHNGPGGEQTSSNRPPSVSNASATSGGAATSIALNATDPDFNALTLRVVSQPAHGRAGISGTTATYVPDAGFSGSDSFTFAANDGFTDSNLGTAAISVASAPTIVLSVSKSGSGTGVVTSSPSAINCGDTCNASIASGTSVTLYAAADPTSRFDGWSGPCTGTGPCTVSISAATTVTALFTYVPVRYTLTVTRSGNGTVTSAPAAINCGPSCSATFDIGTAVTLIATPNRGSTFAGWTGACQDAKTCIVTMTQARSVTATFVTPPWHRAAGR